MIHEILNMCGTVCDIFIGKNPIAFTVIGLCIVILIYIRLRRIDKYVKAMHREAQELKQLALFPTCNECAYRDICQRRIDAIKIEECTYDYRKSLVDS